MELFHSTGGIIPRYAATLSKQQHGERLLKYLPLSGGGRGPEPAEIVSRCNGSSIIVASVKFDIIASPGRGAIDQRTCDSALYINDLHADTESSVCRDFIMDSIPVAG